MVGRYAHLIGDGRMRNAKVSRSMLKHAFLAEISTGPRPAGLTVDFAVAVEADCQTVLEV